MPLCEQCSSLTLEKLSNLGPYHEGPENAVLQKEVPDFFYLHADSWLDLIERAERCDLCALVRRALEIGDEWGGVQEPKLEIITDPRSTRISLRAGDVYFLDANAPRRITLIAPDCGGRYSGRMSIYTTPGDVLAATGDIVGKPVSQSPLLDETVHMIRGWLQDCLSDHESCVLHADSQPISGFYEDAVPFPTRVVAVGSDTEPIRLVETSGWRGTYACLSHCWGGKQIITTTIATKAERMTNIAFSTLSKTFQDAIIIARKLQTPYIWIDSLCIIQDDHSDWKREAPLMGVIYRNATYTIAASGSKDGSGGCLLTRSAPGLPPVTISYTSSRHANSPCAMTLALAAGDVGSNIEKGPLNQRAWTLQERLLSRRIIHFGEKQIYFECQRHIVGEDGFEQSSTFRLKASLDLRDYEGEENQNSGSNFGTLSYQRVKPLWWRWCMLVEDYSRRSLTISSDKLPALLGLVEEVRKRVSYTYFAGLWEQGLYCSLLWKAFIPGSLRRAEKYRAPSWSWASVDGRISYNHALGLVRSGNSLVRDPEFVELSEDKSGAFYGKVAVWGKLGIIWYTSRPKHGRPIADEGDMRAIDDIHGNQVGSGSLDFEPIELPARVTCLVISHEVYVRKGQDIYEAYGALLLSPVPRQPRTFTRVGACVIRATSFGQDIVDTEPYFII